MGVRKPHNETSYSMHTSLKAHIHIHIPHTTYISTHFLHTRATTVHLQVQAQDATVPSRLKLTAPAATTIATIELSRRTRTQTIRDIAVVALENNA